MASNFRCQERAWPNGFENAKLFYIGHGHINDVKVSTAATLEVRPMGDGYNSVISFEGVYHLGNEKFEDEFRLYIDRF